MTPAPRPAAAETAYHHVKALILSDVLPGGTMISEGEIAAHLSLSRTPVREAFLRLESEGWLRLYPKRGALVVPVAVGEAEAVIDARLLLETHAVDTVAGRSPAERAELGRQLRELVAGQAAALERGDLEAYVELDAEFHQAVTAAGGNALLTGFSVALRERQRRMVARSASGIETAQEFVGEHEAMVAHVERGDAAGFRTALEAHLARAYRGAGTGVRVGL